MHASRSAKELHFYRQAHNLALGCAFSHLLVCLAFAAFTDTWLLAIAVGVPALAVPWWVSRAYPAAPFSRLVMAVAFMAFTGLIIEQARGDLEAHFSFFVMMAVLVAYCDWRPIVLAFVVIAIHHLVFVVLQPAGLGLWVFNDGRGLWGHFWVHGAVGSAEAVVLSYLANTLRQLVFASVQVSRMAERIAEGHIEVVDEASSAPRSDMEVAMVAMQRRLARAIGQIDAAANALAATIHAIASGTEDLSLRTDRSAHHIRTTAGELQRFVAGAKKTVDQSVLADSFGRDVQATAQGVGETMREAIETMNVLKQTSRRMGDVISVIDTIARKTGLLAVNASVEASRSGERTSGFAVIATEVRSLAEQARQSAAEVRALLSDATVQISQGATRIVEAGRSMDTLLAAVPQASRLTGQLAERARADLTRLDGINATLKDVDGSIQQNASFAAEIGTALKVLRTHQAALHDSLKAFTVEGGTQPRPRAA
ncbi:MAG TPA: methyl-accepting chemotaxis protein [Methylibium sp.]|nr:methyl-accepting chemotaxis protein [Methylibium sp.]